jgi:CheY-like chemotaxis protein/HPt (histidine-containing phosphotransfer) domain-containing protein
VDDGVPAAVVSDATRLRQILVNLLNNAVKFTEHGEVSVMVSSRPLDDDAESHELYFAVHDTGIGIAPDRMDRLFQSFSQVDASTTRRYGGTGLGLAISKRLAELMGGTVWFDSAVGRGSTFHVTIEAAAAPAPNLPVEQDALGRLAGRRVLVVDHSAITVGILHRHLSSWGMHPRATGSPAEALAWLDAGEVFDVAILDTEPPGMDGAALADEIRRRTGRPVPLLRLGTIGRRPDTRAGGEAATLTRPVRPSQLLDAVVAALGGRMEPTVPEPVTPDPTTYPKLRILLAEDNALNRQLALALLERLGQRADIAVNGTEVLDALHRQPYDLVLMDVQMPDMDGLETTRRIVAEWPAGQRPRIVALTANAMAGDRDECLAAGMDDYLSKPIRPEELAAALARHASGGPVGPPSPQADEDEAAGRPGDAGTGTAPLEPGVIRRLLDALGDDGPDLVRDLVATFTAEAPGRLSGLRRAVESADADEVRRTAHTLKANGSQFGATRLAELCRSLEGDGAAGRLENAGQLVTAIEEEYGRVRAALGRLVTGLDTAQPEVRA